MRLPKNAPAWVLRRRSHNLTARTALVASGSWTPVKQSSLLSHPEPQKRWSSSTSSPSSRQSSRPREARALPTFLALALLAGGSIYYLVQPPAKKKVLNDRNFVPYTITAREAISPGSFVFTVSPQYPLPEGSQPPYLAPDGRSWRHPLWSVEFKQPQVQIARHYTPLPPSPTQDGELSGDDQGRLRFYVRAVGDGEMSNYLSRLGVGHDVWLRGPHAGFDLLGRLGDRREVVFLAGGTGLVPGLQAARAVLGRDERARVTLLWAVRNREELDGAAQSALQDRSWWKTNPWARRGPEELGFPLAAPSPVGRHLEEMNAMYGDRLKVHVAVSGENVRFGATDIQKALTASPRDGSEASAAADSTNCHLHNQQLHERASEFEAQDTSCMCPPSSSSSSSGGKGKNVFIVCGPDGFVSHYAGPKVWEGGRETQGPLGGVAAQILNNNPQLARDWLVLKM